MNEYELSDLADDDLIAIWDYIAEDSPDAATRLLEKLFATFVSLSEMPGMGRSRQDLAPGSRSFPVGNYVIYYCRTEAGIKILRVLHGARKVRKRDLG
jgi:toxin ParE1/3/4